MRLTTILRLEWRNLVSDRTPLWIAALLVAAIAYGAWNGSRWVQFQNAAISKALAEERQRLTDLQREIPLLEAGQRKTTPFADPRLPQALGRGPGVRYAYLPPAPLAPLAIGQSDLYPYYFKVNTGSRQTFVNSDEIENPAHLLSGRFDLAFVILFLYPLLILALSYNIVSGEKESGTLALALSQSVSLGSLVASKILIRGTLIGFLAVVLPIASALMGGADLTAPSSAMRIAFFIGATALYGAFWFALAVAINSLAYSSATNAILLAGLWLLLLIVVPSGVNLAVQAAYPVPSRVEMIQATRVAGDAASRQAAQLLARYLEDHPELAPQAEPGSKAAASPPDFGTLQIAVNDATERSIQPVLDRFDSQLAAQQQLADRFRYLSPAIVLQSALYDIAGSSAHRFGHFMNQASAFHSSWRTTLALPCWTRDSPDCDRSGRNPPATLFSGSGVTGCYLPGTSGGTLSLGSFPVVCGPVTAFVTQKARRVDGPPGRTHAGSTREFSPWAKANAFPPTVYEHAADFDKLRGTFCPVRTVAGGAVSVHLFGRSRVRLFALAYTPHLEYRSQTIEALADRMPAKVELVLKPILGVR